MTSTRIDKHINQSSIDEIPSDSHSFSPNQRSSRAEPRSFGSPCSSSSSPHSSSRAVDRSLMTRITWLQDVRALDRPEGDDDCHNALSRSPSTKSRSTIPIPDISTLTMGLPEMVIASKANDHMFATSPPQYRGTSATSSSSGNVQRKPSVKKEEFRVADLGSMMVAQGVTPIEEITGHHEHEPVPGIDEKRPSIGVTRPSDEDKRKFVEGWTVNARINRSPEAIRRELPSDQHDQHHQSPLEPKRKAVNFSPVPHPTRYIAPRKESDFSTVSSNSGHASAGSGDDPLIYSPREESPPLDARDYSGTILDLVSDPQEIREYRQLERKKEWERRGSGTSGSSGTASGLSSRMGSMNLGRSPKGADTVHEDQVYARKHSLDVGAANGRRSHRPRGTQDQPHQQAKSPQGKRTILGDFPWPVHSANFSTDTSSGTRPSLSDLDTVPSPSWNHASANSFNYSSPTNGSPISTMSPMTTSQHLFHPDLHPVADHHVFAPLDDGPSVLSNFSSSSLPENALYSYSSNTGVGARVLPLSSNAIQDQALDALIGQTTENRSPSSSETIRPPLAAEDGKPKSRTIADCRTAQEGWR